MTLCFGDWLASRSEWAHLAGRRWEETDDWQRAYREWGAYSRATAEEPDNTDLFRNLGSAVARWAWQEDR